MAQPTSLHGHSLVSPGLFLQLSSVLSSTEAWSNTAGRDDLPEPLGQDGRLSISFLASSKANGPTALPLRLSPALAVQGDLSLGGSHLN